MAPVSCSIASFVRRNSIVFAGCSPLHHLFPLPQRQLDEPADETGYHPSRSVFVPDHRKAKIGPHALDQLCIISSEPVQGFILFGDGLLSRLALFGFKLRMCRVQGSGGIIDFLQQGDDFLAEKELSPISGT